MKTDGIKVEENEKFDSMEKLYTYEQIEALIKIYKDVLESILENCKNYKII